MVLFFAEEDATKWASRLSVAHEMGMEGREGRLIVDQDILRRIKLFDLLTPLKSQSSFSL